MPRYVILTHDHPHWHWDLMLEWGSALRTWRLLESPDVDRSIAAERLGDHRALYLDYEGPVSGGRGEVRRWDAGEYVIETEASEELLLNLRGERLRGRYRLSGAGAQSLFEKCD